MRKYKIYLFLAMFIITIFFSTKVNATGTVSLSSNKSTVTVGDEFSINVNLSGASAATLTVRVNVDTSKVDYISGPSNSSFSNGRAIYTWTDSTGGENPKSGTIVTFKFKAKQAGKANFSVSGDFYSPDEKSINPSFSGTSVTIEEKKVTPPSTGGTTGGNTGSNTGGGNTGGSTGSNQGETTGNNAGGNEGGNNQNGSTGGNQGGVSSGNAGNNQGGTNNNTGGTTNKSSNANLKELHLDAEGLSPSFNKNTTDYSIIVQDKNNININAIPEDSKAKVTVSGNNNLKTGTNNVYIKVTAEDGKTVKTYKINVTKTKNPDLANAFLENLAIENVILNPEYDKNIFEYSIELSNDINSLNILAVPQIEGANVNITGNQNFNIGENIITIKVTAKDGVTTKDYIIKAYKKMLEEQTDIEPMNIEEEKIEEKAEKNINIKNIIFAVIIIILICGIIFVIIRRYIIKNKNNYER